MLLEELLMRREARQVVWFHADHWEPWGRGVTDEAVRRVEHFTKAAARSRFARRATLFYLDGRGYSLRGLPRSDRVSAPGDIVEFWLRSPEEDERVRRVVGELQARTEVEFQVHVHHEHLTQNDQDWNSLHHILKVNTDPQLDKERLKLLLKLTLDTARHDTGLPLEKWAFVHGMWALNGSDPNVCQIEDEIQILMDHGCWGDFSFPAGRAWTNPTILEQPYTCKPYPALKAYDQAACDPIAVGGGRGAIDDGRFLIWSSRAKHELCSLDYYSDHNAARLSRREAIVTGWLRGCPVIDGVLYIKTHAHSMNEFYHRPDHDIPFCYPDIAGIFDLLERACDGARVELRVATVAEVFEELKRADGDGASSPGPNSAALDPRYNPIVVGTAADEIEVNYEAVTDYAVTFLAPWIAAAPERRHSAGEYYQSRLAQGRFLEEYDIAVAEYCPKELPRSASYAELGCGFGEVSLMLALHGLRVTGFEAEAARCEGAAALARAIAAQGIALGKLDFVEGNYPETFEPRVLDGGRGVLVATNVTSSYVVEHFDAVTESFRHFDHLIIDVTRFGFVRDEAAQQQLIDRIHSFGFAEIGTVYQNGANAIRHYRRQTLPPALQPGETEPAQQTKPTEQTEPVRQTEPATVAKHIEAVPFGDAQFGMPVPAGLKRGRFLLFDGPSAHYGAFNEYAVAFLAPWVAETAERRHSAGDYYQTRLTQRRYLEDYDIAVAEYCRKELPRPASYAELGCGFGELSLMLALHGLRVTGFEAEGARCEGAAALAGATAAAGIPLGNLAFVRGNYPETFAPRVLDGRPGVLVATNVTSSYIVENIDAVTESFRHFDHLIIDVTRFGLVRDEAAQAELIDRIRSLGFAELGTVYRADSKDIRHYGPPLQLPSLQPGENELAKRKPDAKTTEPVALRYADFGMPVPARLRRGPLLVFEGLSVPLSDLFPRFNHLSRERRPRDPMRVAAFPTPVCLDPRPIGPYRIETGSSASGSLVLPNFGGHYLDCAFGTFKCLALDPSADRDVRALEVFRFLSGNIVHSCIDKATILPWFDRERYVRPDLLLAKLFLSDQPLGLHCEHSADFCGYVLHLLGYEVREAWLSNPELGDGHVVLEIMFPVQQRWGMLDPDYGVVVTDREDRILATRDIMALRDDPAAMSIWRVVEKNWLGEEFDVKEPYTGQRTWIPSMSRGHRQTGDRYDEIIERIFRTRREFALRFEDGFEDVLVEAEASG